jgi:hypothetical protein
MFAELTFVGYTEPIKSDITQRMTVMTATKTAVVVPVLDIDKDRKLSPPAVLQRRIVANLLAHMAEAGWTVSQVYCDGEFIETPTAKDAMELIHGLDQSDLTFVNASEDAHGVRLIPSNDVDMIVDWTFAENDPDGFGARMDEFDAELYA